MSENKEQRLAREIYAKVGGMGNVNKVIHCMTRVRMDIKDASLVNMSELKNIDGVLGIVEEETLQVVLGPGIVNKVAKEMVKMGGVGLGETIPVQSTSPNQPLSGREEAERKTAITKAEQKKKIIRHSSAY